MSIIELDSLTRRYGAKRGVEALTFGVPEGSIFGFLGPNGAGKTTAIRVMLGFLRPSEGSARVFGKDCWKASPEIKREVGYVPGDLRLHSWLTGHEALRLFGMIRGRDLKAEGKRLAEVFGLDLAVRVRTMSKGMKQKLGLILALAPRPRLLVLDEPTSGLDPLMQDRCHGALREMARGGSTVFFSSHTLSEVEALCARVAIIREGRLVANSTLEDLQQQGGHDVEVWWKDGAGERLTPPSILTLERREAGAWAGSVAGPVSAMVDWLAGKPIEDVKITRPDLESLFRRYYAQKEQR